MEPSFDPHETEAIWRMRTISEGMIRCVEPVSASYGY